MISPLIDPALDAILAPLDLDHESVPGDGIGTSGAGGREILAVEAYTLLSGSFHKPGLGGSTTGTEAQILLTGTPGPGSSVRRAILRFVPTDTLRAPRWHPDLQCIDMTFHLSVLPMTLAQLDKPRRFLWMAVFSGGQVYGDLHAAA